MKTISGLLVGVMIAMSACDGSPDDRRGSASAGQTAVETTTRGGQESGERAASVYAAVVRQLVTKDHTFGSAPSPFKRVFIIDGVVDAAGPPSPAWPISRLAHLQVSAVDVYDARVVRRHVRSEAVERRRLAAVGATAVSWSDASTRRSFR